MSDTGNKKRENRDPEIIDGQATEVPSPESGKPGAKNAKSSKDANDKPPSTWPGKVALVLSVVALGGGAYLGWQGWQWHSQTQQALQQVDQQVDSTLADSRSAISRELGSVKQQMSTLSNQAQADKQNIDQLQQRLTQSIQQVTAQQQTSRKDWLLAEVEYLLRLANQRVLMEQTADGALKLLKSADQILKETDDVSIYEVRKALAADIAALEAVPRLDTEGAFLQLGALNAQVDNLRLIPVTDQRELPSLLEEITPEGVSESWSQGLVASWHSAMTKLEQLVVVQHRDEPVEPLLSPEQHFFLQQNLHLMLEQAQLALLQRKQNAFDSALNKAENWIDTYFEPQDATTNALLRGIAELRQLQVAPEMPDISGSLNSLKDYLQQMTKLKQEGAA
ncbi:uroporphyrinogen-III C-methyltransferase [Marinobacterium aestuariivivens]|uniref:Uroporphyrinogen-III C-methyltransferase n=1 Tax=Marinobacterium aestuariivivens TaxID=1698799 RepID=A0ABW2A086_9GAMM